MWISESSANVGADVSADFIVRRHVGLRQRYSTRIVLGESVTIIAESPDESYRPFGLRDLEAGPCAPHAVANVAAPQCAATCGMSCAEPPNALPADRATGYRQRCPCKPQCIDYVMLFKVIATISAFIGTPMAFIALYFTRHAPSCCGFMYAIYCTIAAIGALSLAMSFVSCGVICRIDRD
jgi:hypothetical protein